MGKSKGKKAKENTPSTSSTSEKLPEESPSQEQKGSGEGDAVPTQQPHSKSQKHKSSSKKKTPQNVGAPQGAGESRGQPMPQQQQPPQNVGQPQGAWASRGQPMPQQQQPPQNVGQPQGAWASRGQPMPQQQQPPQNVGAPQGAWAGQPMPQQQQPPQNVGAPQGAWASRGQPKPQQQQPPQNVGQPQGAWASRGQPKPQQQQPPQNVGQPQGAWASRGQPMPQQQQPPQNVGQPQGAWASRGQPKPQQQQPPQNVGQPQGAWASRGQPMPQQQQPPQNVGQPQGAGESRGQPMPQQQQPPQNVGQPQGAWAGRDQPVPQQHQPSPQQGAQVSPTSKYSPSKSKYSASSMLEFSPRIVAEKKSGRPIVVQTNFFRLTIKNPNLTVVHYNVIIEPDKPKCLMRDVWNTFMKVIFSSRKTAFDGKNAYSKGPLINDGRFSAVVKVLNQESQKEKEYNVTIEEVRRINLNSLVDYRERSIRERTMKVLPEAEISVLEIIMKNWACDNFVSSRRSFFPLSSRSRQTLPLSDKLEMKFGYVQSVCMGYVPYLNFDLAHKPFYRSCGVLDILNDFQNRNTGNINVNEFSKFLRTAKVEYRLPSDPNSVRIFRVNKLVENANTQVFRKDDGSELTVAEYFSREKKCKLKYPELPLLWVGPTQKSIYLPMEFCKIMPDQIYRAAMNMSENTKMIRSASSDAITRAEKVNNMFRHLNINNHPLMQEFGLSVSQEMEKVPARVIDPPNLKTSYSVNVKEGVWRIKNVLQPVILKKWCILKADKMVRNQSILELQNLILSKASDWNIIMENPRRQPIEVQPSFAALKKAFAELADMELIFVIISEEKGLYSRVKTICETQVGILTQCLKSKTVNQDPRKLSTTVENILLKVNAKLGGKNHTINNDCFPPCLRGLVMVVGADVTHASPGMSIPSVAAVTASYDNTTFQYGCTTRIQPKGEIIKDLQEMMTIHVKRFKEIRKAYPESIIFFRDGVSEGELPKVFTSELMALKNATNEFGKPKITFLVVQKRHHAKFFTTRKEDQQGKNFNVPVGTCVDTQIVHPRDLDFYLVSHASILGTARPTRYRLLNDDSHLTDEDVEKLTFYLCHMFSRCNRSVSYPAPTYYAHLAAFRTRAYLECLNVTEKDDLATIKKQLTDKISVISNMFFV